MSEKIVGPGGVLRNKPSAWEIAKQEREQQDHKDLIASSLGRGPVKHTNRIPLYTRPEPQSRAVTPAPQDVNSAIHEFVPLPGELDADNLAEHILVARDHSFLIVECLCQPTDAEQRVLIEGGFTLAGLCSKNIQNQSVTFQRWRFQIR